MNDVLVLRSAVDLLESGTRIQWSNKYSCPPGYSWNEDGYVITAVPYPFIRACIGLRFSFLVGRLGMREFVKQNLIALRLLNGEVNRVIIGSILRSALKKQNIVITDELYNSICDEVFQLQTVPGNMDCSFITWRRTWFNEDCKYNTVSKIVKIENTAKIDSDRELMNIDEKYITSYVAEFTGFSRKRIDIYWSEKQWTKKLRTLYTLEEAYSKLERDGVESPSRSQLAKVSGLSLGTVTSTIKDMKKLLCNNEHNVNMINEIYEKPQ